MRDVIIDVIITVYPSEAQPTHTKTRTGYTSAEEVLKTDWNKVMSSLLKN